MPNSPAVTNQAPPLVEQAVHAGGLDYKDYAQIISGAKPLPDTEVDALMIAAQIMMADSLEEGLGDRQAEPLKDHIGEQFVIHDFRLNKSDEQYKGQGSSVYAAIDATWVATGERTVITTGSFGVLGALGLVLKLGTWGRTFTTKKVGTAQGNAFKLIYVPDGPVVAGEDGDPDF